MSGLCGVVRWDGGEVEGGWVEAMVAASRWRGPDGVGRHVSGGVGVASLAMSGFWFLVSGFWFLVACAVTPSP